MSLEPDKQICIISLIFVVLMSVAALKVSRYKGWKTLLLYGTFLVAGVSSIALSEQEIPSWFWLLFTILLSVSGIMQFTPDSE